MKRITILCSILFIIVSSFGQNENSFELTFNPKNYIYGDKSKYTDEIDGLYKYWMYVVDVKWNDIDTLNHEFSIQFVQPKFESEIFYFNL